MPTWDRARASYESMSPEQQARQMAEWQNADMVPMWAQPPPKQLISGQGGRWIRGNWFTDEAIAQGYANLTPGQLERQRNPGRILGSGGASDYAQGAPTPAATDARGALLTGPPRLPVSRYGTSRLLGAASMPAPGGNPTPDVVGAGLQDNPNLQQQYQEWAAQAQDPNDMAAFDQHLRAIGAPGLPGYGESPQPDDGPQPDKGGPDYGFGPPTPRPGYDPYGGDGGGYYDPYGGDVNPADVNVPGPGQQGNVPPGTMLGPPSPGPNPADDYRQTTLPNGHVITEHRARYAGGDERWEPVSGGVAPPREAPIGRGGTAVHITNPALQPAQAAYMDAQTQDRLAKAQSGLYEAQAEYQRAQATRDAATIEQARQHLAEQQRQFDIVQTRGTQVNERDFVNQEAWRSQNRADQQRQQAIQNAQQEFRDNLATRGQDFAEQQFTRRMQENERDFANAEAWRSQNRADTLAGRQQQFGLDEAGVTGTYGGAQTEAARRARFGEGLSEAGVTGSYGGAPTLAAELGRGNLDLAREQQRFQQAQNPYSWIDRARLARGETPGGGGGLFGAPQGNDATSLLQGEGAPPGLRAAFGGSLGSAPARLQPYGSPVPLEANTFQAEPQPDYRMGIRSELPSSGGPEFNDSRNMMEFRRPTQALGLGGYSNAQPKQGLLSRGAPAVGAFRGLGIHSVPAAAQTLQAEPAAPGGGLGPPRASLPYLSAQGAGRLLPSERGGLNTLLTATGTNPEDYWNEQRRLSQTSTAPQTRYRSVGTGY